MSENLLREKDFPRLEIFPFLETYAELAIVADQ